MSSGYGHPWPGGAGPSYPPGPPGGGSGAAGGARYPQGGPPAPSGGYAPIPVQPPHPYAPAPPAVPAPAAHGGPSGAYSPSSYAGPPVSGPLGAPAAGGAAAGPAGAPFGPYVLERELGRGGMGVVYKAYHQGLRRECAVKVLSQGLENEEALKRFVREGQAVAKLGKHPNVVQVFDAGHVGFTPYLAMEYVEGRPLDQVLKEGALAPPDRALEVGRRLALALDHAHRRGIVHRDMKPGNVILDADDEPHILDFGLAKDLARHSQQLSGLHAVVGTPAYMPPEQACPDFGKVDRRSDVYALGALLYHCLSGKPPFGGPSMVDTLVSVIRDDPPPLPPLVGVPPEVAAVIGKAMAKEPERRYQTALELADDLSRLLAAERPRAAGKAGLEARFARFVRGHGPGFALAGFAALALAVTVIAFVVGRERAREEWARAASDAARVAAAPLRRDLQDGATALAELEIGSARGLLRTGDDDVPARLGALLEARPGARRLGAVDLATGAGDWVERDDEGAATVAVRVWPTGGGAFGARRGELGAGDLVVGWGPQEGAADPRASGPGGGADGEPEPALALALVRAPDDGPGAPAEGRARAALTRVAEARGDRGARWLFVYELALAAPLGELAAAAPVLQARAAVGAGGAWITAAGAPEPPSLRALAAESPPSGPPERVREGHGVLAVLADAPLGARVALVAPREDVLRAPTRFALYMGAAALGVIAVAASVFGLAAARRRTRLRRALPIEMFGE